MKLPEQLILFVIFLASCTPLQYSEGHVIEVIDGDTIRLETGEKVRLTGIDAPERGQSYHSEATVRLKELIENKTIILESEQSNKDKYGRILRTVFIDNVNINSLMVQEGYAVVRIVPPNNKHKVELYSAREDCISEHTRLCS